MEILEYQDIDETKWNEYVFRSNNATFYHQIGWKKLLKELMNSNLFI